MTRDRILLGIGMTSQRTRERLIGRLRERGVDHEAVLALIGRMPRHLFVDEALASRAYEDTALPIGFGQTISQPYIVARMTQALVEAGEPRRVLEVGTGSGYQTAVLAQLADEVYTVERIAGLLSRARTRLRRMGFRNIHYRHSGDEYGWPQKAPFDSIVVTAAARSVPAALVEQLSDKGVLIIPVGDETGQQLLRLRRVNGEVQHEALEAVSFVPLIGDQA